jgi:hypothetical protein
VRKKMRTIDWKIKRFHAKRFGMKVAYYIMGVLVKEKGLMTTCCLIH